MLNADRLTVKAAEAVAAAAGEARRAQHPEFEGLHLLKALLEQEDGVVAPVLNKMEVAPARVVRAVDDELDRRARVSGGAVPGASRHLRRAFDAAEEAARELGDAYISTEHLLLGLIAAGSDAVASSSCATEPATCSASCSRRP